MNKNMEKINLPSDFSPEERRKRAEEIFRQGYNCCQAVLLAFSDIIEGADEQTLATIGTGLGGGVARLREVCGAVSGMAIAAGFIKPATDPKNMAERTENYALVQNFASKFREERGSIVCRELLGLRAEEVRHESPKPSERTQQYYHTRPCIVNVGLAARIVADYLVSQSDT